MVILFLKEKNYLIMTKKLNKVKIIDQIEMIRRKTTAIGWIYYV